jgi:hypothetical protein
MAQFSVRVLQTTVKSLLVEISNPYSEDYLSHVEYIKPPPINVYQVHIFSKKLAEAILGFHVVLVSGGVCLPVGSLWSDRDGHFEVPILDDHQMQHFTPQVIQDYYISFTFFDSF